MGLGQVKMPQCLLFLPKYNHFSCLNIPGIVISLSLISRVLKKLIMTVFFFFYQCTPCFYEERIFGGSYSTILEVEVELPHLS